jgi:hypothetical protein
VEGDHEDGEHGRRHQAGGDRPPRLNPRATAPRPLPCRPRSPGQGWVWCSRSGWWRCGCKLSGHRRYCSLTRSPQAPSPDQPLSCTTGSDGRRPAGSRLGGGGKAAVILDAEGAATYGDGRSATQGRPSRGRPGVIATIGTPCSRSDPPVRRPRPTRRRPGRSPAAATRPCGGGGARTRRASARTPRRARGMSVHVARQPTWKRTRGSLRMLRHHWDRAP